MSHELFPVTEIMDKRKARHLPIYFWLSNTDILFPLFKTLSQNQLSKLACVCKDLKNAIEFFRQYTIQLKIKPIPNAWTEQVKQHVSEFVPKDFMIGIKVDGLLSIDTDRRQDRLPIVGFFAIGGIPKLLYKKLYIKTLELNGFRHGNDSRTLNLFISHSE